MTPLYLCVLCAAYVGLCAFMGSRLKRMHRAQSIPWDSIAYMQRYRREREREMLDRGM